MRSFGYCKYDDKGLASGSTGSISHYSSRGEGVRLMSILDLRELAIFLEIQ
ncbi:MAG: hypothetical protein ABSH41_08475 [Syntrophobacteraceae bacterium]